MKKAFLVGAVVILHGSLSLAVPLLDDAATVGLWHMESIYYNELDIPFTSDDDSQNPGREHDLVLFRTGLNEIPPTVVTGYSGNALLFEGGQFANCPAFWSSSYSEIRVDFMIYLHAVPSDLGAAVTYLFYSSVFEIDNWPGDSGPDSDFMRFKVMHSSGTSTIGTITIGTLKNRWLHVVASYDAARNFAFSITDTTTGIEYTVTKTGSATLRAASSDITFGSTAPSVGSKPVNRNFRGMIDEVKISNQLVVPHHAFSPVPANHTTIMQPPPALQWSKGLVADSSDVYFGTGPTDVAAALKQAGDINGDTKVDLLDFACMATTWQQTPVYPCADLNFSGTVDQFDLNMLAQDWLAPSNPLFLGSTPETALQTPYLAHSTTYYWRIASANCREIDPGNIWQFTTGPAQSYSPLPENHAPQTAVRNNTVLLEWSPGFAADTFVVYWGTTDDPTVLAAVSSTSIQSPSLLPETQYFWKVDSVGPEGTFPGTVWNFTTGTMAPVSPSPAKGETDVKYYRHGVELAWESIYEPQSYDVYFGTQNPPPYIGSTEKPALLSPNVTSNTKYYWRVDCISPLGNVTGPVWEFVTATPAFPAAEGFGRFAKGGRGGTVYHVTNLNDAGPGSLRDAVSQSDRTIVFDVGGQIILDSRLGITRDRLTIAGHTAPGDGISIAGPGISIGAKDTIMRHLRIRYTHFSQNDALSLNNTCENVIIDHVSISWGTDEVFSITGSKKVTAQWCIIAEGQNFWNHSKGSLLEWPELTMHHCLYVHNDDRNPKNKGVFDFRNNVVYNWGYAPYIAGDSGGLSWANCVGNYYIAGPDTTTPPGIMIVRGNRNYNMYLYDNRIDSNWNGILDGVDLGVAVIDPAGPVTLSSEPFQYPTVATDSPETAYQRVLEYAGCWRVRDSIDTRIISDVINQTGQIIYAYQDVGGLGTINGGTTPLDSDQDGMPDDWEIARGLDIHNPDDRNHDPDGSGYTNLEIYLNELAGTP